MFFRGVGGVKIFFLGEGESFPLFDDFGDELRLSHSGELMPVLVVLLSGEFPVELGQLFLLEFALH